MLSSFFFIFFFLLFCNFKDQIKTKSFWRTPVIIRHLRTVVRVVENFHHITMEVITMSRYKSKQTTYNPLKKKNVPIWRLDTNTVTVTHFNSDTLTLENKTYHTDFIKYHLHYSDGKYPDRLRRLVNEVRIEQYLDDMELKVSEAITRQVELWKQTDSCYQKAVLSGDAEKMLGLENCFVGMAREIIFECMVYI